MGKFLSPDTIIPAPGHPQSLNRYAYTANNPLRYTDPTGHWLESALDIAFIIYDVHDIAANGLNLTSGLSLVADVAGLVLPAVTGGGLLVRTIAHADDVTKAVSHVDDIVKGASHADELVKAASKADDVADAARAIPSNPCSFDADTPVLTPAGLVAIERLQPGDTVLAYDEALNATGVYTVTHQLTHLDPVLLVLTIDDDSIDTTPEHPFYTLGGGWTPADDLVEGDLVRRADGGFGAVEAMRLVVRPALMYNLTVAEAHTFFVGEEGWLVHNACPIFGKAQVTSDPTHAARSNATAQGLAKQPSVVEVHLNRTLSSVSGGKVSSLRRPDVAAKYADGSFQVVEIHSPKSQTKQSQLVKARSMNRTLNQAGLKTKKAIAR